MSAWVSTPPVIARVSTMVTAISFLRLKGWHAPAGRLACEPRPLVQDGQIGPAPPVGARKLGPGRQIVSKTARCGVSRFGGQAGTQVSDATPPPSETGEAGPEALPTPSLPTRCAEPTCQSLPLGCADYLVRAT